MGGIQEGRLLATLMATTALLSRAEVSSNDLYRMIRNDDSAGIKEFLARGGDVNLKDSRGATPLMYTAISGSVQMMKLLLDGRADVNARDAFGDSALLWSAGDLARVRLLLGNGGDVNVTTKQGRTPLLTAARRQGNEETVRLLLAKGADVKATDVSGDDALQCAAQANDTAMVKLFLAKGLDVNARGRNGWTPLMRAAGYGNLAMVRVLLDNGAQVNVVSAEGRIAGSKKGISGIGRWTALHRAAAYGSPAVIRALLDAGADVDAKDIRGMTPLMLAVASGTQNPEVVRLLMARGADPAARDRDGQTAHDWAMKFGDPSVLKLLPAGPPGGSTAVSVAANAKEPGDIRKAVARAVTLLQSSSAEFFKQSGCASCHHQYITAMAVRSARDKGLNVDEKVLVDLVNQLKSEWGSNRESLLQRLERPGSPDSASYALFALAASDYPPDQTTDAMVFNIAAEQTDDGSWRLDGGLGLARPPIEDQDIARTAMALRSLQLYGPPGRKAELQGRIEKAGRWLLKAKPRTTEEQNMQLLGLKWAGAERQVIEKLAQALLSAQRGDGGWGQNLNLPSDAYATGQAVYALHEAAGLSAQDVAYQRGVRYLLTTQLEDGSWHVRSRAPKFQPYFESGFPHGQDQWISSAATAWASMALSLP